MYGSAKMLYLFFIVFSLIVIDPEVCYNDIYEGNMTQKYYGRFVCPGYSDPDDYRYCCGSVGSQRCCDEPFDSRYVVVLQSNLY